MVAASLRHFIFGYGSLICSRSRAITSPEQSSKVATPVLVKGLERTWSKRVDRVSNRYTALGVRFDERAKCAGVVLPVSEHELDNFDDRENGYTRTLLSTASVERVPYLSRDWYLSDGHYNLQDAKDGNREAVVWVYIPKQPLPPTPDYPILQSYVDIVLRGCLSISEQFAVDFIATTRGWSPDELTEPKYGVDGGVIDGRRRDGMVDEVVVKVGGASAWVDDRHDPKYKRSDPLDSRTKAAELDRLLQMVKPDHFIQRQPLPHAQ